MGGSPRSFYKTLFGALALVGCFWLLFVGLVAQSQTETRTMTTTTTAAAATTTTTEVTATPRSIGNFKRVEVMGKDKLFVHPGFDLNYMSKRRVPNGPDPIHNRRAGNSRQPPGQA